MLVADWIEEWTIIGQNKRRWAVARPASPLPLKIVSQAKSGEEQPSEPLQEEQPAKRTVEEHYTRLSPPTPSTSLPVTMPTPEEMEYLKSRPWEKAELEGKPVDWADVAKNSGYDRAMGVVRDWNKQKRKRRIKRGNPAFK